MPSYYSAEAKLPKLSKRLILKPGACEPAHVSRSRDVTHRVRTVTSTVTVLISFFFATVVTLLESWSSAIGCVVEWLKTNTASCMKHWQSTSCDRREPLARLAKSCCSVTRTLQFSELLINVADHDFCVAKPRELLTKIPVVVTVVRPCAKSQALKRFEHLASPVIQSIQADRVCSFCCCWSPSTVDSPPIFTMFRVLCLALLAIGASAHLCLISPHQRGTMGGLNKPGKVHFVCAVEERN